MAPKANPPVCRIMDYGKFKFDEAQRAKESRRKTTSTSIKEMKYRPKIGTGDFDTKTRQVARFLAEGHKVKITIMFRGREMSHPELGQEDPRPRRRAGRHVAKVEAAPKLDGRNMIMVLAPDRRAQQAASASTPGRSARGTEPPSRSRTGPARRRAPPQLRAASQQPPPAHRRPGRHRQPKPPSRRPRPPPPPSAPTGQPPPRRPVPPHRPRPPTQPRRADPMPKMKTDRGAAKRFKVTGTGKLRRRRAFRSHILEKKSSKRTRRLGREADVAPGDAKAVKRLLGL